MRLFHANGACSLGVLAVLEEIGAPYDLERIDLKARDQTSPAFRRLNPKAKVPVLVRDDGSVLTEFPAIVLWLAESFPDAHLVPAGLEGRIRALELIDFVVSTLHMRGFTLARLPGKFAESPEARDEIAAAGRKVVEEGFEVLTDRLGAAEWFLGAWSIADAAVFYTTRWAVRDGFALPAALADFHRRSCERPAIARAIALDGGL